MKRKYVYGLQVKGGENYYYPKRWKVSSHNVEGKTTVEKLCSLAQTFEEVNHTLQYRVVQKLGRKVIKVIYPRKEK